MKEPWLPFVACAIATVAVAVAQSPGLAPARELPGLPRIPSLQQGACFLLEPHERSLALELRWFAGTPQRTAFVDWTAAEAPDKTAPETASFVIGDFDGDGADETLLRRGDGYRAMGIRRAPDGARAPGTWFSGRVFDIDGDRKADLCTFADATVARLVDALGTPRMEPVLTLTSHLLPGSAIEAGTAGDFDRDGKVDLLLALPERGLVWCRGIGAAGAVQFTAPIPLWPAMPGERVTGLLLADLDQDGWLDVFVSASIPTGNSSPFAFSHREDRRDRTPAEEARLQALLQPQPAEGGIRLPSTLHTPTVNPFERMLEMKERRDRIQALQTRESRWLALPVRVHRRKA